MNRPGRITTWLRSALALTMVGCVVLSLMAQDPNAPASDPTKPTLSLKITRKDSTKIEAGCADESIAIRNDYGTMTYKVNKIRSLTCREMPDGINLAIELDDRSRVQGKAVEKSIQIRQDGQVESLKFEEFKSIKFVKKIPTSVVAVILGLLTLALMEIVLGVDNIIFLAILVGKLPPPQQPMARSIGLGAALGTRIILLFFISWLIGLTRPLFTLPEMPFLIDPEARDISLRDMILFAGGMFLVWKSVKELHHKIQEAKTDDDSAPVKRAQFWSVIVQIAIMDIVFSFDSVITGVGMVEEIWVMVTAMIIAMVVMLFFAGPISRFVDKNPAIKVLALSFLILIGVLLIAESLGQHIDKGYIYFAMAFAVVIELVNMRLR